MAGHSKWANIQHRKGKQDQKKAKVFTRLIRELTVSAREGSDINANPRLRLAVDKAYAANMSKDVMDRAIKRGAGELEGIEVEEIWYEGYGPSGVAVMVECLTDNRNRTVATVRHAFSKCGGNLGTNGSVSYLFVLQGVIHFPAGSHEEKIMEIALEAGADDVEVEEDGQINVITSPGQFQTILAQFTAEGFPSDQAEIMQIPVTSTDVDAETSEKIYRLIDMLEELDDVQNVYTNANLTAITS